MSFFAYVAIALCFSVIIYKLVRGDMIRPRYNPKETPVRYWLIVAFQIAVVVMVAICMIYAYTNAPPKYPRLR